MHVGREGLLDQQGVAGVDGGEGRRQVIRLIRGDDRAADLVPREQCIEVGRKKVRARFFGQGAGPGLVAVADAEPADAGMVAGDEGADPADRAAADDGDPDRVRPALPH